MDCAHCSEITKSHEIIVVSCIWFFCIFHAVKGIWSSLPRYYLNDLSLINQISWFFNLIFGGSLQLDPIVRRKVEASRQCSGQFHHTSMTIEVKVVDQKCDNWLQEQNIFYLLSFACPLFDAVCNTHTGTPSINYNAVLLYCDILSNRIFQKKAKNLTKNLVFF